MLQLKAGRTRFAQARAKLSMTDCTAGPSSPNHAHCRRPENCEEEEELGSEGEDAGVLKARSVLAMTKTGGYDARI